MAHPGHTGRGVDRHPFYDKGDAGAQKSQACLGRCSAILGLALAARGEIPALSNLFSSQWYNQSPQIIEAFFVFPLKHAALFVSAPAKQVTHVTSSQRERRGHTGAVSLLGLRGLRRPRLGCIPPCSRKKDPHAALHLAWEGK